MGSQRVRQDWSTFTFTLKYVCIGKNTVYRGFYPSIQAPTAGVLKHISHRQGETTVFNFLIHFLRGKMSFLFIHIFPISIAFISMCNPNFHLALSTSAWRTWLDISFRAGLWWQIPLAFVYFKMSLFQLHFLKNVHCLQNSSLTCYFFLLVFLRCQSNVFWLALLLMRNTILIFLLVFFPPLFVMYLFFPIAF